MAEIFDERQPMTKARICTIQTGNRHRKDMGDLGQLADSINRLGLLQPIGITKANALVFGERRLRACRDILKWTEIEVRVVDIPSIVEGEQAENEIRKEFSLSERVAIGKAVEAELANRRGERTDLNNNGQLVANLPQVPEGNSQLPANWPEVPPGAKTRDIAAKRAGFSSASTYRNARSLIDSASPALVDAVETRKATVSAAAAVATLPIDIQEQAVAAGPQAVVALARQVREERRAERVTTRRIEPDPIPAKPAPRQWSKAGDEVWSSPMRHALEQIKLSGGVVHYLDVMTKPQRECAIKELQKVVSQVNTWIKQIETYNEKR